MSKFVGDLFYIRSLEEEVDISNYALILTVEVSLINLVRGEIIDEDDLLIKMIVYILCFRFEVGLYGRDIRGLIRMY